MPEGAGMIHITASTPLKIVFLYIVCLIARCYLCALILGGRYDQDYIAGRKYQGVPGGNNTDGGCYGDK